MTPYENMLESITYYFNDKIKKACDSLFKFLNLNNFWYYKITNTGRFSYFGSNAAWTEYFATKKFYLDIPYYRHPKYFHDGISFMNYVRDEPFLEHLSAAKNKFNFNNPLLIINKICDGLEAFGFSSHCSDEMQKIMMFNELPLLRLFIKKFREENSFLFSRSEDHQIDLVELIGSRFYEKSTPVFPQPYAKEDFLKKMGIENPLSPREIEVARLLCEGYSASQIGKQIFLSSRTIEHHLERMKEKLGCSSKAELIQKARELEDFGCLCY